MISSESREREREREFTYDIELARRIGNKGAAPFSLAFLQRKRKC
jgi:hypothetical protein